MARTQEEKMSDCPHEKTFRVTTESETYMLYEVYCSKCGRMIDSWREYYKDQPKKG